ncbi:putative KH domain-containing protein [Tricladium varicosporioides]|nr:putative KH domain-containing protein [Hymenoscyphus varicosporioides]
MASTDSNSQASDANGGLSAAQKLMQKHDEAHKVTIEDVPDEEDVTPHPHPSSASVLESADEAASAPGWAASMSAKAAGKQKAAPEGKENVTFVNTQSETAFPSLGPSSNAKAASAPIWGAKKAASNGNGVATNGSSTPKSGMNTPPIVQSAPRGASQSLAGQVSGPSYSFEPKELPRSATKKPLPDILRDINKKYRTNLTQTTGERGTIKISESSAQVPDTRKRQAFKELGNQITIKSSAPVEIPRSARAHIIGKQGSTIKSIQEMSGARVQMPKMEDAPEAMDDDDYINVMVEGNPIAIRLAQEAINKIANERGAAVNVKLRDIPAEFYPFLAGPNNAQAEALEQAHGIQMRVPPHHTWTSRPPPAVPSGPDAPVFLPAAGDNHIALAGDRVAVQAARAEIARRAQQLQHELTIIKDNIDRGRHQFIVGNRGLPVEQFFAETGCSIVLPGQGLSADDDDYEKITIIGPADRTQAAMDRAIDLAMGMQTSSLTLPTAPGAKEHARNLTQYLRECKEIERIEKLYESHIFTELNADGSAAPWQLYSRDGKNVIKARSEINRILEAHPPTRMTTVPMDPFFHPHLKAHFAPEVKTKYGVSVVTPQMSDASLPVLLVFEGESAKESEYQVPRGRPSAAEVKSFQQGLQEARQHILDIIKSQSEIESKTIDVPRIFHDKLKKFIKEEQQKRAADQFPVRVKAEGTRITLFGPAPSVKSLSAKVEAFVEQATEDEKERGFTMSFDFPQKHANQLIGRGGSYISELRDKFDVDIKVDDGKVELKGPKAKAEAAKAHISKLGAQWADEATYILKIEPQYHSEIIGAKGGQINKLLDRYKVQIHFPRSARAPRDDQSNADAASDAGRRGPRREQEPDEVIVKGPKKGADGAREEILSLLQYYKDNSHTASVSVQAGQIPSLIGSRGAAMDEIRQITQARIDIPNARDFEDPSSRVEIQIKGTKAQVAQAKKMIEEKKEVFDNTVTKTLEVEKKFHGALIGPQGSTIRDIVIKAGGSDNPKETARTVQFPKAESEGNAIRVQGRVDVVDKIIAALDQIVSERKNQTSEIIEIPTDKHRSLIGRGGETKKELESKFKVFIDIPRQGNGQTGVKISGLPADVASAKAHITDLVKEQEGETMQVPRRVHHSISDNGQFFRKLRNDHKVSVDHGGHKVPPKPAAPTNVRSNGNSMPLITDEAADTAGAHVFKVADLSENDLDGEIPWILRGSPESVAKARAAITAAVEQAMQNSTVGYLTLPDPRTYRYVIGQGGSKVNSIRKATGCKITVPRDQAKDEPIEIVGSAEGVEKARDLILQAVIEGGNANSSRS